ncbi:hypothetical protein AAVH_12305 [Aphelenchoides avenae]|nr:hypothetical protein AAVH_12305 [Aphelenchus avenae]
MTSWHAQMPETSRNPREMELNALWSHLELDGRPQMWQIKSLQADIVSVNKNVQEIEKNELAIGTSFTGQSKGLLPFEDGGAGSSLSSSTLRTEDGRFPKLYIRTSSTDQPNGQKGVEVQVKCDELLPHEYMLFKAKVTVRVPGHTPHVRYFYEVLVNNMWNDGKFKHLLIHVEKTKLKETKLDVVIEPFTVDFWRVYHQLQLAEAWLSALTKERELTRANPHLASLISGIRESVSSVSAEAIYDSERDAGEKTKQASSASSTVDSFDRVSDAINDLNVVQDS